MQIRRASFADLEIIVEFNRAMARETEQLDLLSDIVTAGVAALLQNPANGFYILAQRQADVVGSLMITTEWSDWRNGNFWWIQSVYVAPAFRRQGVYRQMYQHVKQLADEDATVCGFRLYVERDNARAQETYLALGMQRTPYRMFEELKPGVRFV